MATSAQAVSRILSKAGIRKSETGMSRVSSITTEGFTTEQHKSGLVVFVGYETGHWNHAEAVERKELAKVQIRELLNAKGYTVSDSTNWNYLFVVTKGV